jgi:CRP/FNR family transcriptional regulator, cyclic AMP receptor protein
MDTNLLDGLSDADRDLVLSRMSRRSYATGEMLIVDGDVGDSMHIIEQGKVAVRKSTVKGEVVTLTILGPGASFGEQALLSAGARRTAHIVALEPVVTRAMYRSDFEALRRRHPAVERFLIEALAAQVRRLSGQVVDALYLHADQRVVKRLVDLAALYDTGRPSVEIPLRQEDLASMAGITRPTANRVLRQLSASGLISVRRGRTTVLDQAALRRMLG